jgi:hypothetical protein
VFHAEFFTGGRLSRRVAWCGILTGVARMNIVALAARQAPGADRATVVLSVTDDAGKPIDDLLPDHLFVRAAVGPEVTIVETAARGEGVYLVQIVPAATPAVWPSGEHVLAVAVRRLFDRGQSLAVLVIP